MKSVLGRARSALNLICATRPIQMPFVIGARTVAPDAICEMRTKAIDPQPDRFPADNHTALGQQVFDVSRAHCEAMVSPNSVCDDFA
jgi:hypothetical protein